eukprot:TRINITY_DN3591_c0_g1_i5.p3 TRINITY_DN3591_c0_g1~~TRINITY_DN3591_c0_g1_i5.p3  ORF type:complete len:119 (+),score=25.99 TRINITY_DN3591_c0_g1_i5:80-436(+)
MAAERCFLEHEADWKYIIAEVEDDTDKVGETYTAFISYTGCDYHSDIVREWKRRIPAGSEIRVRGGGIVTVDKSAKKLFTYGTSGAYGAPDAAVVERILKNAYPAWTVEVTITDYVRD